MSEVEARARMVAEQIEARGVRDSRVLAAMRRVPRHLFAPAATLAEAHADHPLPIGEGQTISQPYMVAWMTAALALQGYERVLEVGTGSGYQAAILAELASEVVTLERFPTLALAARAQLTELGYGRVQVLEGDGSLGVPDRAPFQAILVTAGAPAAPPPLLEQLEPGGRLVVPVGDRHTQVVEVHVRLDAARYRVERGPACRFVDLAGAHGWFAIPAGEGTAG